MGKPACMDEQEFALWTEANNHGALRVAHLSVPSPCHDCPLAFAESMRAIGRCDGEPKEGRTGRPQLSQPSSPRATYYRAWQAANRERVRSYSRMYRERRKAAA